MVYSYMISAPDFDPLKVLHGITGFVEHFFTCRECVENFGKGVATMKGWFIYSTFPIPHN